MTAINQTIRGMRSLPHVGPHPGVPILLLLIFVSAAAGAQRAGIIGAVFGALFMLVCMGSIVAFGAYDRALTSDRISARTEAAQNKLPANKLPARRRA